MAPLGDLHKVVHKHIRVCYRSVHSHVSLAEVRIFLMSRSRGIRAALGPGTTTLRLPEWPQYTVLQWLWSPQDFCSSIAAALRPGTATPRLPAGSQYTVVEGLLICGRGIGFPLEPGTTTPQNSGCGIGPTLGPGGKSELPRRTPVFGGRGLFSVEVSGSRLGPVPLPVNFP
jgi:hypothetical protein